MAIFLCNPLFYSIYYLRNNYLHSLELLITKQCYLRLMGLFFFLFGDRSSLVFFHNFKFSTNLLKIP